MHNTRVSQLKKYLANSFQLKYLRERERERERELPKIHGFFLTTFKISN